MSCLSVPFYPSHFVCFILSVSIWLSHFIFLLFSVSFCLSPFVNFILTLSVWQSYFVFLLLSVSFYLSHFVSLILSLSFCQSHFVCLILYVSFVSQKLRYFNFLALLGQCSEGARRLCNSSIEFSQEILMKNHALCRIFQKKLCINVFCAQDDICGHR